MPRKGESQGIFKFHLSLVTLLTPRFRTDKVKYSFDGVFSVEEEIKKDKGDMKA